MDMELGKKHCILLQLSSSATNFIYSIIQQMMETLISLYLEHIVHLIEIMELQFILLVVILVIVYISGLCIPNPYLIGYIINTHLNQHRLGVD